jgi:hypothetical protein
MKVMLTLYLTGVFSYAAYLYALFAGWPQDQRIGLCTAACLFFAATVFCPKPQASVGKPKTTKGEYRWL